MPYRERQSVLEEPLCELASARRSIRRIHDDAVGAVERRLSELEEVALGADCQHPALLQGLQQRPVTRAGIPGRYYRQLRQ